MSTCALCNSDHPLRESHIIPSFVFDMIKNNSPTGFLRGGITNANMRRQDGDKLKLLCGECEQRFSNAEKTFAEQIFKPYHETGTTSFHYGDWLSYFICSVNWRTLHLDNIDFHSQKKWKNGELEVLDSAEKTLADFLIGKRNDIAAMENHILPIFEITQTNSQIEEPNFLFRVSAFDYTVFDPSLNAYYICANLAGILIFTIIRKGENDVWDNTIVHLNGGSINESPVHVSSPLMSHMMKLLISCTKTEISQKQKDKLLQTLNPTFALQKKQTYIQ